MRFTVRAGVALLCALAIGGILAGHALAAAGQVSIAEDDPHLMEDPAGTLQQLRLLGAQEVRVAVRWQLIAPRASSRRRPAAFDAADPAAYPAGDWDTWDRIVLAARQVGIKLLFDVIGGAPLWATARGAPTDKPYYQWEPSPAEYGAFVRAVATRYSGSYDPKLGALAPGSPDDLPAVIDWSLWNEPNYGPSLAPQGVPGRLTIERSPAMYRALLSAGWNALQATGHRHDTILFGELAPTGTKRWGVFSGMRPLVFLRALYCVDASYRPWHGRAATDRGCPATAAGSRGFRAANPALFAASGFSDHPYMGLSPPNRPDPASKGYARLADVPRLEQALDRLQRTYGSTVRFPIYDTEFGYLTSPPKHATPRIPYVSQPTAAAYLNWAEYISWRRARIQTFDQYLLYDPLPALPTNGWGSFASGLINWTPAGRAARAAIPKPTYYAWRMPLFLPVTSARAGRSLEVWACVRPATFATADTGQPQSAQIQFSPARGRGPSQPFRTLQSVAVGGAGSCYFDVRVRVPSSGTVRVAWRYPMLEHMPEGPIYSRNVTVSIH
jgi:hypothetical protein